MQSWYPYWYSPEASLSCPPPVGDEKGSEAGGGTCSTQADGPDGAGNRVNYG